MRYGVDNLCLASKGKDSQSRLIKFSKLPKKTKIADISATNVRTARIKRVE